MNIVDLEVYVAQRIDGTQIPNTAFSKELPGIEAYVTKDSGVFMRILSCVNLCKGLCYTDIKDAIKFWRRMKRVTDTIA